MTCVEFEVESYSVSLLNYTLSVTLVLSGQPPPDIFDVFVIATNTSNASCELHINFAFCLNNDVTTANNFVPGKYIATFSPGSNTSVAVGIPVLNKEASKVDGLFGLELYIPSASYELGIDKGSIKKATAKIIYG